MSNNGAIPDKTLFSVIYAADPPILIGPFSSRNEMELAILGHRLAHKAPINRYIVNEGRLDHADNVP